MADAELLRRRLAELGPVDDDVIVDSGSPLARAHAVEVTGPYRVRVRLADGCLAEADLEGLAYRSKHFARLRDPALLGRVEPVHEGAALRFGDDDDLEIGLDLILALAERQRPMSGQDFAAWMRRHGLSDNTAADVLGLAKRTVQGYKAAATLPPLVAVACRAFDADTALLPALYRPRRPGRRPGPSAPPAAA